MKRGVLILAVLAHAAAFAVDRTAVHARFGATAFNCAVPAGARETAVFSPYSFEIGCAAISDGFDSITKAHFAETVGVMTDLVQAYGDIMARMGEAREGTNRFSVMAAHAICLPDLKMATVPYRRDLQSTFGIEVCPGIPTKGAESWLRAAMDGEMEDFDIPLGTVSSDAYAAYDLVSVRFSWKEPFPADGTGRIAFRLEDGTAREVEAMRDLRNLDLWRTRRFSMARLPIADDAWFCALLPAEGLPLEAVRGEFSSDRVDVLLAALNTPAMPGVTHGPAEVVVPKMDVTSDVDLEEVFLKLRLPLKGFQRMDSDMRPASVRQRVRLRVDEQGLDPEPNVGKRLAAAALSGAEAQRFVLDRPFLFFIYHEPTETIPVAGQFTGI